MKYDNKYKESIFKFKSMFHGIKCTEFEKTTAAIDQESLNPTYKLICCILTAANCVPSRICARVIMIAIIK